MKIAIIGQKGIPSHFGGVEKHVEDLSTRLVRRGHEVLVYTRPNYADKDLTEYQGVKLISLSSIPTKHLDAISHTFRTCLDVAKRDVDVVHFHSIGPSSLIWFLKLLRPNLPIVATFHSQCYKHRKWGFAARTYLKFGEFVACKIADKTMTVSKSLRNYVAKKYDRLVDYAPNGVPAAKNVSVKNIKYFNLKKDGYVLAVSRFIKHKGLHYLIEAYKNIKTDKKLVIVGDGAHTNGYVKYLKDLADGNKNIVFTGAQSGRTLAELFSNAYLFVQPSEAEGLSIALLEAMSYGKTTLVSDIKENKEVIDYTGFTFKNKSVADLMGKLNALLRNPDVVRNMGKLEKKRVTAEYNWKKIVDKVQEVYNNAIINKKEAKVGLKLKLAKKFLSFFF